MKPSIEIFQDDQITSCKPEARIVFTFANGARVEVSRNDDPRLGESLLITAPIDEASDADSPPPVYSLRISPGACNLVIIEPVAL